MGTRIHGVASRTGKIESRAGKVEGRRFLRLKFRRTRYHNRSHIRSSRRVAGPLGQMLRCRVTAGEVTDMPERSAVRGSVDINLLQGGGSNPSSSRKESANLRSLSGGMPITRVQL